MYSWISETYIAMEVDRKLKRLERIYEIALKNAVGFTARDRVMGRYILIINVAVA